MLFSPVQFTKILFSLVGFNSSSFIKLNSKAPTAINKEIHFPHEGNGYEYSGIEIPIPKGSIVIVEFSALWENSKSTGVALSKSDVSLDESVIVSKYENEYPFYSAYVCIAKEAMTLHVWGKYSTPCRGWCRAEGIFFPF